MREALPWWRLAPEPRALSFGQPRGAAPCCGLLFCPLPATAPCQQQLSSSRKETWAHPHRQAQPRQLSLTLLVPPQACFAQVPHCCASSPASYPSGLTCHLTHRLADRRRLSTPLQLPECEVSGGRLGRGELPPTSDPASSGHPGSQTCPSFMYFLLECAGD